MPATRQRPAAAPAIDYRLVPGPMPGGALAALTIERGDLVMHLDAGAPPGQVAAAAGALESALGLSSAR